jgi:hypothetical protein
VQCFDLAHDKHKGRVLGDTAVIKCKEFPDQLWNCSLLRNDSAVWSAASYLANYYQDDQVTYPFGRVVGTRQQAEHRHINTKKT